MNAYALACAGAVLLALSSPLGGALAHPAVRWQVTPRPAAFQARGEPHVDLFLWPAAGRGTLPGRFRLKSLHALGSGRGAWVDGDLVPAPPDGRPIDLALVVDLGGLDPDADVAVAAGREVVRAFRSAPRGSSLRVLTYPYRGDRRGPGGDESAWGSGLRLDPALNDQAHRTDPEAWQGPLRIADSLRAPYTDLAGVLADALTHIGPQASADPPPVRALVYVTTATPFVGLPLDVVEASRRAGNVPLFAMFYRSTAVATAGIAGELRVPTVQAGFEFHHLVTSRTGGWILSADLRAAVDDRTVRVARTAFDRGRRMTIPADVEPLRALLAATFAQLSRAALARVELPCLRGPLAGGRWLGFEVLLGAGSELSVVDVVGGCASGLPAGAGDAMCVYADWPFSPLPPSIDEVIVWSGEQRIAGGADAELAVDGALLDDQRGRLLLEVRGRALCGDAELHATVTEHNGIQSIPRVFAEVPPPPAASVLPESRQRFFALYHLADTTRRVALDLRLGAEPFRPGTHSGLPLLTFASARFSLRWLVSLLLVAVAAALASGTMTRWARGRLAALPMLPWRRARAPEDPGAAPTAPASAPAPAIETPDRAAGAQPVDPKRQRGFTLVEQMIVVAMVAALAALGIRGVGGQGAADRGDPGATRCATAAGPATLFRTGRFPRPPPSDRLRN